MTIQEIINTPWEEKSKWDTKQVSRAARTLSLAANKRLSILEKHEKTKDIAVSGLYDHGRRIEKFGAGRKSKDMTNRQFRTKALREVARAERFLKRSDTTYTHAHEMLNNTKDYFHLHKEYSDEELFDLTQKGYSVFNKIIEIEPTLIYEDYGSDGIFKEIGNYMEDNPNADEEEILQELLKKLDIKYEEMQRERTYQAEHDFNPDDIFNMSDEDILRSFLH